jgi:hypothetical protein
MSHSLRRVLIIFSVLALIILPSAGIVTAADNGQGKGPPDLERIVFVHPKVKDVKPSPVKPPKEPVLYSYSRYHWSNLPVTYYYNPSSSPVSNAQEGVIASFEAWEAAGSGVDFTFGGTTGILPGLDVSVPDYKNVVGWAPLNDPGAIAITIIWSNTRTKLVVDTDTIFNLDSGYTWVQGSISEGIDPDLAQLTNTSAYDVDVQNIMTHEAGHWLVLNDLYTDVASEQTMYGYASDLELKKRSLESGDIAGVNKIYP